MIDKYKTDPELGNRVHEVLVETGIETPMAECDYDDDAKKNVILESVRNIMRVLNLDLEDDSLSETPKRIAKMYVDELYCGLDYKNFPKITTIENKMQYSSMLMERHIKVSSTCEHHFVPILGEAFVAYIPKEKVIGLSKINRVVEFFSRRPQVQERLVEQIFQTLCYILDTENVAVFIRAEHTCVKLRGVEDVNSDTITSKLGGAFMTSESLRNEFFHAIEMK